MSTAKLTSNVEGATIDCIGAVDEAIASSDMLEESPDTTEQCAG